MGRICPPGSGKPYKGQKNYRSNNCELRSADCLPLQQSEPTDCVKTARALNKILPGQLATTLKSFPRFNSSLSADGKSLYYKKYFNIGIAVDTPNGLVVPVLTDVNNKSIFQLSEEMTDLSTRAREKKLKPSEMQGASMTISSLGGIGGAGFTPIVNPPEVAILGITRAKMQPVWNGDAFIPQLMCPLDLTYDHRVIDGADGARFMSHYCRVVGDIRKMLLY